LIYYAGVIRYGDKFGIVHRGGKKEWWVFDSLPGRVHLRSDGRTNDDSVTHLWLSEHEVRSRYALVAPNDTGRVALPALRAEVATH